MKLTKNKRIGISALILLFFILSGNSIIKNLYKNDAFNKDSPSMSQPDDNYEPNNDISTAYILGERTWLSTIMGYGVQHDDDWYEINVDPGEERLVVFLRFFHGEGNIDLELYNGTVQFIVGSFSTTDDEFLDITVPAGLYFLKVYYGNNGNQYDLMYDDMNPGLVDDYYEENDFFTQAYWLPQATWLSSNPNGLGILRDEDWYNITLDFGEEHLFAELVYDRTQGNLDIFIYNSTDWFWFDEVVDFTFMYSGTYSLLVNGTNSGIVYDLWYEDLSPTTDDWMEENDDIGNARPIPPNSYPGLSLLYGDEDWFQLYLNAGDEIDITIYFNHYDGDLQLELYDPYSSYRTGSFSSDDDEYISFITDYTGNWSIRVYHAYADSEVYYDLDIWVDDAYEENDDFYNAWYMDPNYYPGLRINYGDEDWYRIYLNPGETIDISIYFNNMVGNLELELFDPYYSFRVGSYNYDNNESIYFTSDVSGEWRIHVYHADATSHVLYDMDIWVYGGDDWMEENDEYWDASWVDPDTYYSELIVQHGDEDWYRTYLNAGDEIEICIYFNHYDGDLQLELYDPNYNYHTGAYSSDNDEFIHYIVNMSGDWRIRVYHKDANSEVYYDLELYIFKGDDWMEENDDYWSARYIDPNYYPNLLIIEGDDDWFRTYLNPGDEIEISIYFNHYEGDLQLELYDPYSSYRTGSFSSGDDEYIPFDVDIQGDWRFRIYHQNKDSTVRYDLELKINGEMGRDDPYEYNNGFEEAYDLSDDECNWLSDIYGLAIQGDEDWYMIEIYPGFQHLIVNLTCNLTSQEFININLYRLRNEHDFDWNPVYSNYSITGDNRAVINESYLEWGIYLILINGDSSGVEYDLWWNDTRTDFRLDDSYEEKQVDDFARAWIMERSLALA
ncbi:MAG: PPC domain-containing protein, partial [Promethearchaeota archaeon]